MDNSTAEYIQGLTDNLSQLAENLNAMGVSASISERFDGLIPKILAIPTRVGIATDTWTPISNSTEFVIENIPFIPAKIAIACDDVLNYGYDMVVPNSNIIAILNVDFPMDSTRLIELNQNGQVVIEEFTSNAVVTVEQQSEDNYKVTLSLTELNAVSALPYYFKGGYEHTCVITDEGWFNSEILQNN